VNVEDTTKNPKGPKSPKSHAGSAGGGAAYFLGFIGALVYFIQSATSFWDGAYGVFQAFVWPAYLVYGLFDLVKM
jgi:hypothetical protein